MRQQSGNEDDDDECGRVFGGMVRKKMPENNDRQNMQWKP